MMALHYVRSHGVTGNVSMWGKQRVVRSWPRKIVTDGAAAGPSPLKEALAMGLLIRTRHQRHVWNA